MVTIYRQDGTILKDIEVNDDSCRTAELMGYDMLALRFTLTESVAFPLRCYSDFGSRRYRMFKSPEVTKRNERQFDYVMPMYTDEFLLHTTMMRNCVDYRLKFPYTATPREHLEMIVANLNLTDGEGGWAVDYGKTDGMEPDASGAYTGSDGQRYADRGEMKTVSFEFAYCIDAISAVAQAFDTEYEVETWIEDGAVRKYVSLHRVEYNRDTPLEMRYGRDKGFVSGIVRRNDTEVPPVDRLYIQGGEQNIPEHYGQTAVVDGGTTTYEGERSNTLLLPKNTACFYRGGAFYFCPSPIVCHYSDGTPYILVHEILYDDKGVYLGTTQLMVPMPCFLVSEDGRSLQRVRHTYYDPDYTPRATAVEAVYDASEIYPMRVGGVNAVRKVNASGELLTQNQIYHGAEVYYDICDIDSPDLTGLGVPGETMTVIFQSGMLAGKEFECKYIHEAVTITNPDGTTYTKAARRFEIVPQEIDGIIMPNSTYAPAVNGKYIVFGCSLPDSYVCDNVNKVGASWDMFREGVRYLYEHEEQKFTFTGTLQGLWAKQNWENVGGHLKVGGYILFTDTQFAPAGKLIRITGIKEFLTSPYTPTIEISSSVSGVTTSSKMKKIDNVDVLIEEMNKNALSFTKRRFRDAKETIEMLNDLMDAGFDNFTNGINPITVQTMSMLVGDESLQFRFVDRKTDPISEVTPNITYSQENKQMTIPAGILQHMTLGIDQVKATHSPSEYKFWDVAAFTSGRLIDPAKKYYLYVRANRANSNAVFLLSETAHKIDEGNQYYWMLVGVLNSEYEGERSFATLYGFTEVLPGRITTKKIVSPDGTTYFDLVAGEIGGNIYIKSGSRGLQNLQEWGAVAQDLADMNDAIDDNADAVSDLGDYVDGAFADGIITEAEAIAIQKYINTVNNTKETVLATYTKLYANAYLEGNAKTGLLNAKVTLMGAIETLINAINTAIAIPISCRLI